MADPVSRSWGALRCPAVGRRRGLVVADSLAVCCWLRAAPACEMRSATPRGGVGRLVPERVAGPGRLPPALQRHRCPGRYRRDAERGGDPAAGRPARDPHGGRRLDGPPGGYVPAGRGPAPLRPQRPVRHPIATSDWAFALGRQSPTWVLDRWIARGCPVRRWIWVGPCDGSYGQAVTARSASGWSAVACSSAAARAGSSW
jgi:hypothetical protein